MEYSGYWNDEALERGKPYWIENVGDQRLLNYLRMETNLLRCFEDGLVYAEKEFGAVRGIVFDLGAGVCWTTGVVSRWPNVKEVHAFDYSKHRLFKIAPLVFQQLNAVPDKVRRHCEAMSPLARPDESVDLAIFCQALYMVEQPDQVLCEVYRVLRPGGVVMISCESIEAPKSLFWHRLRHVAAAMWRYPVPKWKLAMAGRLPDASGRYAYRDEDYARFVVRAGFRLARQPLEYPVLKGSTAVGMNYFGVKA